MPTKKVSIGAKPSDQTNPNQVDMWVADRKSAQNNKQEQSEEANKRLTIDIPSSLHRSIKLKSVMEGVTMAEMIRDILAQHFSDS